MSLQNTPRGERLHIAVYGKRNSGKSTLINAITGQEIAITSPVAGTTADPVYQAMEVHPIGPCVFIDTAGFDDEGDLGKLRVAKTVETLSRADVAILVCAEDDLTQESAWLETLRARKIPTVVAVNQKGEDLSAKVEQELKLKPVVVNAKERIGTDELLRAICALLPEEFGAMSLTAHLVEKNDVVLLVMPQDKGAPKGRLILPQVQTIRDLLDHFCITVCTTLETLPQALGALKHPPKAVICDSQVFPEVERQTPKESILTSFSVLFARYKGDLSAFRRGADAIDRLKESDRVLIAESCTHKSQEEDIGRVKIPRLLRKKVGEGLTVDVVSGADFKKNLTDYALIIHCGGCMVNRAFVLSRIREAEAAGVPITNYGIAIAKLTGILDKIQD
ncbi:MAG: [Oscillospiraceae bacterium]|nr:[FeFe] hydrogenase H-cluster maturation GTPase HydF [Oscillospiraceae bacterium]